MQCPRCNAENREGAKFCMVCGASLAPVCPQCGRELLPEARFCDECGAQVAAPPAGPSEAVAERLQRLVPREFAERLLATRGQVVGERRVVTMLFSDVKGSTPMAEQLDPEDVLEIMDGAFDVLIEPITRYEGALARLMGDGILAFFGAPIAHEDDAERACRAALEILEGARAYAARLEAERGISGFNVRVGIHTGLVVVGEVGSDLRVEYTAMGDAVNLASRMEETAEPGTVLITEDTQRLIARLFQTEPLGSMEIRGKAEPVSAYRVLAPRAVVGKPRGIEGLESPLVGRDTEFAALCEVLERLQAGVGGIVTIVGEAGIGKSRLVAELRKAAAPLDIRWAEGRCLSYGESMAYLPWLDMLHGLLGTSADEPPAEVRDALRRGVEELCPDHFEGVYPFLGRMMSLPPEEDAAERLRGIEPEGLKVLTFRAVERVLEAGASEGPVVLVVEDLHWADDSSLELLEQLLGLTDRVSLLLLCALRPYREHRCWRIRQVAEQMYPHRHVDLYLRPLSVIDSEELVANLLHVEALPHTLRRRILDHAEGNPFYVEEVIRSLIDSGAIVYEEGMEQWEATRRVEDIAIPDTLQGVLMARIDRLDEAARRVLQTASVVGRIFPYKVLAAITEEAGSLDEHLLTLQREEMIREWARMPELEYMFKHHLTEEAAYSGLLRRERRRFHRQVAEAWERLFPERIEEQLGLVAYHWEQAGERVRAIDYLRRAGEQAAAQFANDEAVDYFSRALELTLDDDLAGRYELLLAREEVYGVRGASEAQRQDQAALEQLAEALDDDAYRVEVALRQSRLAVRGADYPPGIAAAQRAIRLAHGLGDLRGEATGYIQWGSALHLPGDDNAAQPKLQQALALARAAHLRQLEAHSLRLLSWSYFGQGDFDHGRSYTEQSFHIYHQIGDRQWENVSRISVGRIALHQGDYDEAKACFDQAVRGFREIGDRWNEAWAHQFPGTVYQALGDYQTARSYYEECLRSERELGDRRGQIGVLYRLSLLWHDMGDDETAREYAQQALEMALNQGDRSRQVEALIYLSHALMGLGNSDEASGTYLQGLELAWELGQPQRAVEALAGLARVSLAQGDLREAQAHAEEILSCLETNSLDALRGPSPIYLTCYRVLRASGDARADDILQEGYHFLEERAAKISDERERRSYLENVAANREIVEAYAQRRGDVAALEPVEPEEDRDG